MGYFKYWNEPIKISKPLLTTDILILCIIAHILCTAAIKEHQISNDHIETPDYPMPDFSHYALVSSTTIAASSTIPLILFNPDGTWKNLNSK